MYNTYVSMVFLLKQGLHPCKNRKHTDKSLEILKTCLSRVVSIENTVAGNEVFPKLLNIAGWVPSPQKKNLFPLSIRFYESQSFHIL